MPGSASDGVEAGVVFGEVDDGLAYFPPCEGLERVGVMGEVLEVEPEAAAVVLGGGVYAGGDVDAYLVGAFGELFCCGCCSCVGVPIAAVDGLDGGVLVGDGDYGAG